MTIYVRYFQEITLVITKYFSIVLDARVSIVTVSKLVDVNVSGNCVCPSGSSGNFESIEKARNVSNNDTSSVICDPFRVHENA